MNKSKKTAKEDIRNPEHYFNKYISCEIKSDRRKQSIIQEHECSLDEKVYEGHVSLGLICNQYSEVFDESLNGTKDLSWLETIEDERLFDALKLLKPEQLKLLSLYVLDGYTHRDIATQLGVNHKTVCTNLKRILTRLRNYIEQS